MVIAASAMSMSECILGCNNRNTSFVSFYFFQLYICGLWIGQTTSSRLSVSILICSAIVFLSMVIYNIGSDAQNYMLSLFADSVTLQCLQVAFLMLTVCIG